MTLLRLSSLALSRSRFALSPLAETLGTLLELGHESTEPWSADWHARHRPAFLASIADDPFAQGLVRLLSSTKFLPAHVVIPPRGGMGTRIADELPEVAAMSDVDVHAELLASVEHSLLDHDLSWLTGHDWAARTAALLDLVWREHIAPEWPKRRVLLERDVTYRAGLLAAYGWPRALHRMSKRSAWVGADAIRFSHQSFPDRVIGEDGMLFVPTSLASGTWLCEAEPARFALVYPARGRADPAPRQLPAALARLLGENRAAILTELAEPATSSELAAQLELSLGTIGGHLSVLREAGLILGARVGRRVVYRRTDRGDVLVGDAGEHTD